MNFKHKFVFLLPGLLVLIGILIFPIVFTVRLSLSGWNSYTPELNFIGLDLHLAKGPHQSVLKKLHPLLGKGMFLALHYQHSLSP